MLSAIKLRIQQICAPDLTEQDCEQQCRSNQIKELCGCTPITFSKNYESGTLVNCTMNKLENCSQYLRNEDKNCTDECVSNCAQWHYAIDVVKLYGQNISLHEKVQEVTMTMSSFDYIILTEEYTWTFESFIGAFGGVLGIWLGLDFGVLIELVFTPIIMLLRKLLSKKGASNQRTTDNVLVRWRVPQFFSSAQIPK